MIQFWRNKLNLLSDMERNAFYLACEGTMGAIIINLVNPFVSMFAKRMGAGDVHIGLLSSLPALVGILALIPGSFMIDRQRDKKRIVAIFILLTGMMYPLAAATPYLGGWRVGIYVAIIALLNWPFSIFNISWQSFFSEVFPPSRRSHAFTLRSKAATFFGMMTTLAAGLILSYIPRNDGERIIIYQVFFMLAFGLALIQSMFLMKVDRYALPEEKEKVPAMEMLKASVRNLWVDKPFLHFVLIAFIFHMAWQMAWPLFFIYQVDYLHANEAWLSYIGVANGLAGVATFSYWNRMIEKKGAKWVIIIGALGLAVNPIALVMTRSLFVALLINAVVGLTFSAFQLALFENMLEVVPQEYKTLNIALYTTMLSVSGLLAPMLGIWIYKLSSIYFVMTLNGVLRLLAAGLFVMRYWQSRKQLVSNTTA